MKRLLLLLAIPILFLSLFAGAEAMFISASGGWSETVDEFDLVSGAGSDLTPVYESAANATILSISGSVDNTDTWRVDVKRVDSAWHGDFTLYVRRTSEGTGGGTISGGDLYIEVTTVDGEFFYGAGDRSDINVQYKLSGMSVRIPPDIYSSTIVYTVVDI
ncbi:MAG: hypothetical protein ACUVRM_08385 [Bacillota bacterium]